ncbi:MAG: hypothetical protein KPEEDBHJ_03124 [Anaerolineales bacterium]|nr:hypothetical protein [Anaerolineales bacterium]
MLNASDSVAHGVRFRFRSHRHIITAHLHSFANRHSHTNKHSNAYTHLHPHACANAFSCSTACGNGFCGLYPKFRNKRLR